ncbi:acyltransferase family protein [Sagittula salina]|uniref:Acyltransferase n=1 Tax=Sagittula salina TaxID=2820268 RepID=A0A940MUN0_9RHOB|nr:acyltransferase [Sagittula salina]MBP0483254.1 acyltransferase [Sagittula salina]
MTLALSLYLDALRFGAAFVVLLSHWAYPRFTDGRYIWIRDLNLGSDAVVIFFVLSGLVVAFAAHKKDGAPGRFAFQRMTRLWSVAIPALLLTLALDRGGAALWPAQYEGWFYEPLQSARDLLRAVSLTSQWGDAIRIGTNGPWWSLSYEAAFYLLFALWSWTRGLWRVGLLTVAVLVVGPNALLLMPAWIMGVALWRRIDRGDLPANGLYHAVLPPVIYVAGLALHLPGLLSGLTVALLPIRNTAVFGFSDEFVWNAVLGVLVYIHLTGVAALSRNERGVGTETDTASLGRVIRWLAGGSFSLYLLHYPVLQFAGPHLKGLGPVGDVAQLALACVVGYGFAAVFERTLPAQRRLLRGMLRRDQPA